MNLGLSYSQPTLDAPGVTISGRLVRKLNSELIVPTFSATYPSWIGASYIVARFSISTPTTFAIRRPIQIPSDTFVACIKANGVGGEVLRYKLWDIEPTITAPAYAGQVLSNSCAALEIWSVEGENPAHLDTEWHLPLTELTEPSEIHLSTPVQYRLPAPCYTHDLVLPAVLDDYLAQCNCGS